MTFSTLFGGELFCMPQVFGERHALQAWGTCNTSTDKYAIGRPKAMPQVLPTRASTLSPPSCLACLRSAAADSETQSCPSFGWRPDPLDHAANACDCAAG